MVEISGLNDAQRTMMDYLLSDESVEVREIFSQWIRRCHQINPASWSLNLGEDGRLKLNIGQIGLGFFSLGSRGWLAFYSESEDFDRELVDAGATDVSTGSDKGSFGASYLRPETWLKLVRHFGQEISFYVERSASRVSTNTNYWQHHRADIVEVLRSMDHDLPDPVYVRTDWNRPDWANVTGPTGYWRANYAVSHTSPERTIFQQGLEEGCLILINQAVNRNLRELIENASSAAQAFQSFPGIGPENTKRILWFVNDMKPGDHVAAYLGKECAVFGEIIGDYEFLDGKHVRAIDWQEPIDRPAFSTSAKQVGDIKSTWGVFPITKDYYQDLYASVHAQSLISDSQTTAVGVGTQPKEEPLMEIDPLGMIQRHFAHQGLNYTDAQIADFYTALQTKGFVVLSGISGTGKSRIARHFTELLPYRTVTADFLSRGGEDADIAWIRIQEYNVKQGEIYVPKADVRLFPPIEPRIRIDVTLKVNGAFYPNCRMHLDQVLKLGFKKEINALIAAAPLGSRLGVRPVYHSEDHDLDDLEYIELIFESEQHTPTPSTAAVSNTLFLSVRPDWRDGTSLLGYYNPLTQTYEWTEFLRFIMRAADNARSDYPVAWFVILDEMNLAHVEYYFADMLSVLESGRDDHGFTREPLRITFPEELASETPPQEVYLPPNLYIIGTVNMDETTHAFSPKVLDRAFTMELSDVDFTNYPQPGPIDELAEISGREQSAFLRIFTQEYAFPQVRKQEIAAFVIEYGEIRQALQRLNALLAEHRFHFGYRVFDEVVQFLANAEKNDMYPSINAAFDSAVFMKILPKFSGTEARVGAPLEVLIKWSEDPFETDVDKVTLPRTYRRTEFMKRMLEIDGFVTAF